MKQNKPQVFVHNGIKSKSKIIHLTEDESAWLTGCLLNNKATHKEQVRPYGLWSIHNNHYYGLSKIRLGVISFPLISWIIVMNIVCKNLPDGS